MKFDNLRIIKTGTDDTDEVCNDVQLILFTSGSTGKPKAIMLTESGIVTNIKSTLAYLHISSEETILHMKQLYHASGIISEALLGLYNGNTIVLLEGMAVPSNIYKHITMFKINVIFTIPGMLKELYTYLERKNIAIESVKLVNFYGAPIDKESIVNILHYFPYINIIYSYGLTEAGPRVTYADSELLRLHPDSVGKPIDCVDVSIMDSTGRICLENELGEVTLQGTSIMKGYYKDSILTDHKIVNNVLHTGDLGFVDKQGFLYITGRKDNMFIRGGKNIYPEEIEKVILSYPNIDSTLVVQGDNEQIIAYVESKECILNDEMISHCQRYLEDYKVPNKIEFKDIEITASGKIKRFQKG